MAEKHKESLGKSNKKAVGVSRQVSAERVSDPEELNDFIRVTTPSVWIVLIAAAAMLAGMLIWSVFGTVERHNENGEAEKIHPISYVMN